MADVVVFFILKLSLFELQTISAELKPLGDGPEEMENGKRQSVKWQVEFHIIFNCLSSPFLSLFHILHTTPFLSFTSFTPLFLLYFSISLFLADKLTRDDDRIYVIGTHERTHTHTDTHPQRSRQHLHKHSHCALQHSTEIMPNWVSRAVLGYTEQQTHTGEVREGRRRQEGR